MAFLFLSVALVLVSTINAAPEFYQNVAGDCDKLPGLFQGKIREVPAGQWNILHATFGVKCGSLYALIRPKPGYGDISVLPEGEEKEYQQFTNDVTYEPEKMSYNATSGGRAYVMDTDSDNYCYYVQCQNDGKQTSLGIIFAVREGASIEDVEEKFNDMSAKLKGENLLPEDKIYKLSNENCPPLPKTFKPMN